MKIVAITQPYPPVALLRAELGPRFDEILWFTASWLDSETIGAPDPGELQGIITRERPDIVIGFGRLICDVLKKSAFGFGKLIEGPALPDMERFNEQINELRSQLSVTTAPATTAEPTA